jgi:hypothetical protein
MPRWFPLSLAPSQRSALNNSARTVGFRVVDVGDPVAGATVTVAGHSATTNANGYAMLVIPRGSPVKTDDHARRERKPRRRAQGSDC